MTCDRALRSLVITEKADPPMGLSGVSWEEHLITERRATMPELAKELVAKCESL